MKSNVSAFLYFASSLSFALSLWTLSRLPTSRYGNVLGMTAIMTAVAATIGNHPVRTVSALVVLGIALDGSPGTLLAQTATPMPQLLAGLHSLIGMAAVLVAASGFSSPEGFNIDTPAGVRVESLIEISLGAAFGAATFAGSVVAYLKLSGKMRRSPCFFRTGHVDNIMIVIAIDRKRCRSLAHNFGWATIGHFLILPLDVAVMPITMSILNSSSRWAAASLGFSCP
ncbi:NAD(P)(+) transhydrogenase (Re/Si-specific) subunit beta [Bradyrhizobium ottawaense]|uniref:NAD(P)(+) transhydrogenase (Re/Si-specific) subunit beta n=1 Tax=Bradyrhizobium ottawaense TaxID=931866 RepID=UPI0015CF4D5B|nr:NAD(P)(+) transhydrogenase (Re/Si-specific) subunit beta [Bradyrhizobium ottawaense]